MSRLRGLVHLLDPWAALLLGALVVLAVIILLATPGPWHRVVGPTTRVQLTPPPPRDVAVLVNGSETPQRCTAALWLHVSYEVPQITVVVVPVSVRCPVPGAGYAPLAQIVRDAGPEAAAAAFGERLLARFGAWVYLEREALVSAFPGVLPHEGTHAGSGRAAERRAAWSGELAPGQAARVQARSLRRAFATTGGWPQLNLIAFANYVLGSKAVETDLSLAGAAAIGKTAKAAGRRDLAATVLPCEVAVHGRYRDWRPEPRALLALRQAFAFDAQPPAYPARFPVAPVPARLLVVASRLGSSGEVYRNALAAAVSASAGARVDIDLLEVASPTRAPAEVRRLALRRPPLAVIALLGCPGEGEAPAAVELQQALVTVCTQLERAGVPAVVSELPASQDPSWTAMNAAVRTAAEETGAPLSPVAALLPASAAAPPALSPALMRTWATLNARTLVRTVAPEFFAPRLASTRLRFSYLLALGTDLVVAASFQTAADALAASARTFGFAAEAAREPLAEPGEGSLVLRYRAGQRRAALVAADDLIIPATALRRDDDAPGSLVLSLP